ncbi:hypothetical protein JOC58_000283 [Paenibacillus hunanensis]|uniref:Uncharacterized protein n=1 Tax=Paenibacillus hunanensis TaxID=539262 RepID=A0ABU1IT21_9BACL|nr:hypothetical protein [Paenibacillus hunanensis]
MLDILMIVLILLMAFGLGGLGIWSSRVIGERGEEQ